jgi:hypothetical protein
VIASSRRACGHGVEIVTICLTPASWARLTISSRSSSKSAKSRWQCVSISISALRLRRDVTREDRLGASSGVPAPGGRLRRARRSRACPAGATDRAAWRPIRHERLQQDGDLAHDFGRDVEHGAHARRIGLLQRPWRLAGEIAVGLGNDGDDRASARWINCLPCRRGSRRCSASACASIALSSSVSGPHSGSCRRSS